MAMQQGGGEPIVDVPSFFCYQCVLSHPTHTNGHMTNNPELGTIVNDIVPDEDLEALQKKIELLEMSRINLRVAPSLFDRLNSQAEFNNLSIEDYCQQILVEHLNTTIGKATISAPSWMSGTQQQKVVAPVGGLVTRA